MIKNIFIAFVFALVLLSPVFAEWGELTQVRVLDGNGRLLKGANVNITWEISKIRGTATTKNKVTGADGMAELLLTNVEFNDNDTNYDYTVTAGYGNVTSSQTFTFQLGTMPRTIQLPVYYTYFYVNDRAKNPVSVGLVVDGYISVHTDSAGVGTAVLGFGNHTLTPDLPDLRDSKYFPVSNDSWVNFTVSFYKFGVRVIDDNGNPLDATAYIGSQSKKTSEGWAFFSNLSKPEDVIRVDYGRYKKSVHVNLDFENSTTIVFDTHPPAISGVTPEWTGQNLKIRAMISDLGQYASGLRAGNSSIELYYTGADMVQKKVPMYAVGYNLFEGLVPVDAGKSVRYIIQATDADGNFASEADTFVAPTSEATDLGDSEKPPASEFMGVNSSNLPFIVVGGAGIVAIVFLLVFRRKKTVYDEDEMAPPPPKPSAPSLAAVPKKTPEADSTAPKPPAPPAE